MKFRYLIYSNERIVSNTIDEIKKICSDLGFKIGTEKHGDCVLKLFSDE
jgi:hypothetical protein